MPAGAVGASSPGRSPSFCCCAIFTSNSTRYRVSLDSGGGRVLLVQLASLMVQALMSSGRLIGAVSVVALRWFI